MQLETMMAEDVKGEELTEVLRESFAKSIRIALTGLPAHQALQLADTLCTVQLDLLAGKRVRYKAKPEVDGEAITEDWRRGVPLGEITVKHGVSKPTAYKYHPGKTSMRRRKA